MRTALEGEIKSLSEQLAEAKGKSADVDDRLDVEYDSGVAFCYQCIMSVLKEEYPELDMSKLEARVQRYMTEVGQGDKEHGEQDKVEAPLNGMQEGEAGVVLLKWVKGPCLLLSVLLIFHLPKLLTLHLPRLLILQLLEPLTLLIFRSIFV